MHHELSKDGENHKLGCIDRKTEVRRVQTESVLIQWGCTLSHKLGASFCLFCFDFYFVRPPHYLLFMGMLLELWVEIP